jgi:hypothetical protein
VATNSHTHVQQQHQQPAVVEIALGYGDEVHHSGIWMLPETPDNRDHLPGVFDHREQRLIDQACIYALEELEPEFDRRPVQVAYLAEFESEEAAAGFADWFRDVSDAAVWSENEGGRVLMGFDAPLDEEMLLKGSLLVHYAANLFNGFYAGWAMKEPGKSWMMVSRVACGPASTLH